MTARLRFWPALVALSRGPIARGALTSIGFRIGVPLLGFAQAVLTARLLRPDGYGTVAVALAVASIAATVSMLGFGPLAVREIARLSARGDRAAVHGFVRSTGTLVLVTSVLAACAVAALALGTGLGGRVYRSELALAAAVIPSFALLHYCRGINQGLGKVIAAQMPGDLVRPVLFVSSLAGIWIAGLQLTTDGYLMIAVTVAALATGLAAGLAAVSVRRMAARSAATATAEPQLRRWSRSAAPFLTLGVLGILSSEATTVLVGWLAGPREAGLFQPVARIAPLMLVGLQAIVIPYAPRVAALWERGDKKSLQDVTMKATVAATALAIATIAVILAMSGTILGAFGAEFRSVIPALAWIAAAQAFNAACGPVGTLLTMAGSAWSAARAQAAGIATTVLGGLILIPDLGAHGGAIALAMGIVAWNGLMVIAVKRRLGVSPTILVALGVLLRLLSRSSSERSRSNNSA